MRNLILGRKGELAAQKYLKKLGYRLLDTNFRCVFGELDIVASYKGMLVVVEVKTRTTSTFGMPRESVTATKRSHIIKCAIYYQQARKICGVTTRFDVIEVAEDMSITHLIDAFRF